MGKIYANAYTSPPTSPAEGDLWMVNGGLFWMVYDGTQWKPKGPHAVNTLPVLGDFTWVNQGASQADQTYGHVWVLEDSDATRNVRVLKKSAPSTPYTVTVYMRGDTIRSIDGTYWGALFRQSSDGKLATFGVKTRELYSVQHWTDANTRSSVVENISWQRVSPHWLRIGDDGVNRTYEVSVDGQNWWEFYSEGRTTFLTADEVGFFVGSNTNVDPKTIALLSWEES